MKRALEKLKIKPNVAYIDGPFAPKTNIKCKTLNPPNLKNPNKSPLQLAFCCMFEKGLGGSPLAAGDCPYPPAL